MTNLSTSAAVEQALSYLRQDAKLSVTEAARKAGAPRTTVGDHWRAEKAGTPVASRHQLPPVERQPVVSDGLRETPDEGEIPVFVRDYSHLSHLNPYPIGDLHIGSDRHAGTALDSWLAYLLVTPNASLLNTGDNLNCAIPGSVSDTHKEKLTVQEGRRELTAQFRPLAEADKIDAIIDGNHELRVYRATGDSPNAQVADALGLNYAMSACIVRYLVGDQSYDCYMRHGKGGGGMIGGAVNNLQRQENIIDADLYVSGHTHTQVAFPKNIFVPNGRGGFRRKKRLFVCSGSFMGYEDYAAENGYAPSHIGAPRIFLDGRTHDLHASV